MSTLAPLHRSPVVEMTVEELAARVGAVPLWRVRTDPLPGTADEDDVERLRAETGILCELVDGVLVEKAVSSKTAFLAIEIARLLANFIATKQSGWIIGPDGFVWLLGKQLRAPDVSFFQKEQLPGQQLPEQGFIDVAPALAIEIMSPGNTPGEMERKRSEFFAAGTRLFWLIDPERKIVEVSTGPSSHSTLHAGDILDGGEVLPGFSLNISELFAAGDLSRSSEK